jgi:hypothetical protein
MNDTARQIFPVAISVLVIVSIAVLRAHSKTLAAITTTMPLKIPLAVWIIYSVEGSAPLSSFTGAVLAGMGATVIFTVVLWLGARAGMGFMPMLGVAYLAWIATLGVEYVLRTYVL